jgi:glycosyltransferase involved in cell wall biosynthesis
MSRLKVLVLSRNYPNKVLPNLGLWVHRLVQHSLEMCEPRVISPVPYCPPLPGLPEYTRYRAIEKQYERDGITVYHPRFLVGPGQWLYNTEAMAYYAGIRRLADRIRRDFPFEVIHAHFSYPDGVVGAWLGKRFGVPVVVTEHALWKPWMEQYSLVRRQAVSATRQTAFHIAVSQYAKDTIEHFTGVREQIRVIPVGVDGTTFCLAKDGQRFNPNQVLFVGFPNYTKGLDILLIAFQHLLKRQPEARLVLVGGSFYKDTRLQEEQLRKLVADLGIADRVEFAGRQPAEEVARYMRESAVMVLPSRRESFGAVLVEALACGTPVVATRCGGPDDIVTDEVGILVPPEDVESLADGIERVLEQRERYDSKRLREYALEHFSWNHIARRTVNLYHRALGTDGSQEREAQENRDLEELPETV